VITLKVLATQPAAHPTPVTIGIQNGGPEHRPTTTPRSLCVMSA
jgi:hypothetical protein